MDETQLSETLRAMFSHVPTLGDIESTLQELQDMLRDCGNDDDYDTDTTREEIEACEYVVENCDEHELVYLYQLAGAEK